jgi:hypothetical protein
MSSTRCRWLGSCLTAELLWSAFDAFGTSHPEFAVCDARRS